jgi:DHA1 family bicyclomycin/chloramphenicol resistance-like MFS transporter
MVTVATSCFAAFMTILFVVTAAGVDNLWVLIGLLLCANAFLGLVIPTTMVLSLDDHGPIAGMASALGGTLQMLTGGVAIVIMSMFFDGTTLPMVAAIWLSALAALGFAWATLGRPRAAPQPAE